MSPSPGDQQFSLRELLHFYADAGVDEALLDEPLNRFVEAEIAAASPRGRPIAPIGVEVADRGEERAPAPAFRRQENDENPESWRSRLSPPAPPGMSPSKPETGRAQPLTVPDGAQVALARDLARSARSLDELREQLAAFDGCNLKFTAKSLCFADGNPKADLMLVGEAPGRDEDIQGLPFVGRSGQLLDRMLAAIGRNRDSVYVANTVPWRPPGNRAPAPLETEICRPFIERQIELANPKVLIALGAPSAKLLLNTTEGIMRLRGRWQTHTTPSGTVIPTMPTLHPAYLLRTPAHKRLAWRDLLEVKARLRQLSSSAGIA